VADDVDDSGTGDEHDQADDGDEPVINFIFNSPDGEEYVLVLVESRPWDEPGVIDELADRIDLVVRYVLDGDLVREFPETAGRAVRVHVDHLEPADTDAAAFFLLAADRLGQRGLRFTAEQLHEPTDIPPDGR
jgi:hypothetical protein